VQWFSLELEGLQTGRADCCGNRTFDPSLPSPVASAIAELAVLPPAAVIVAIQRLVDEGFGRRGHMPDAISRQGIEREFSDPLRPR
jgi:hypothetical protein